MVDGAQLLPSESGSNPRGSYGCMASGFRIEVPNVVMFASGGFNATSLRGTEHERAQRQHEQRARRERAAAASRSARATGPSSQGGAFVAAKPARARPASARPVSARLAAAPPPSVHTLRLAFAPGAATHPTREPRSRADEIKLLRRKRRVCGAWLAKASAGEKVLHARARAHLS